MKGRRLRSGERQGEEGRGGGQRGRETRVRVGGEEREGERQGEG